MKTARMALLLATLVTLGGCAAQLRDAALSTMTRAVLCTMFRVQGSAPLTQSSFRTAAPLYTSVANTRCSTVAPRPAICRAKVHHVVARVVVIRAEVVRLGVNDRAL